MSTIVASALKYGIMTERVGAVGMAGELIVFQNAKIEKNTILVASSGSNQ